MSTEYSDYSEEDLYQTKRYKEWLESRPRCDYCDEPIEEDYAYEFGDDLICETCLQDYIHDNHLKRIGF